MVGHEQVLATGPGPGQVDRQGAGHRPGPGRRVAPEAGRQADEVPGAHVPRPEVTGPDRGPTGPHEQRRPGPLPRAGAGEVPPVALLVGQAGPVVRRAGDVEHPRHHPPPEPVVAGDQRGAGARVVLEVAQPEHQGGAGRGDRCRHPGGRRARRAVARRVHVPHRRDGDDTGQRAGRRRSPPCASRWPPVRARRAAGGHRLHRRGHRPGGHRGRHHGTAGHRRGQAQGERHPRGEPATGSRERCHRETSGGASQTGPPPVHAGTAPPCAVPLSAIAPGSRGPGHPGERADARHADPAGD